MTIPDIRLYKSKYTAEEANKVSQEKGSIIFSTLTKRIYVDKQQYGSNVQDIKWKADTEKDKYTLQIQQVDGTKDLSISLDNSKHELSVQQKNKTTKIALFDDAAAKITIKKDITAKNLNSKEPKDEVLIPKGTNIQNAINILAKQFENTFVWKEWSD